MSCGCGLTLDRWRRVLGFNPYHFFQLANTAIPVNSSCNTLMREYAWQNTQQLGRDDIREAIRIATERLAEHLHYYPYPRYIEEVISLDSNFWRGGWGCGTGCISVRLNYGKVIAFGVEAYEALDVTLNGQAGGMSSTGGTLPDIWAANIDGLTFDINGVFAYPAISNIPVFAQNTLEKIECKWLIPLVNFKRETEPELNYTTVYAPLGTAVKPTRFEGIEGNNTAALDPANNVNFVSSPRFVKPYTKTDGVTVDDASVIFEYDNACTGACGCGNGQPYTRLGQASIKDANTGEVMLYVATYDPDTETWSPSGACECSYPSRVRVRYYAGDDNGCKWDEVVARMAVAELTRRPCGCDTVIDEFSRWYTDRALIDPNKSFAFRDADLGNPFGTRAGHLYGWARVKQLMLVRGLRV